MCDHGLAQFAQYHNQLTSLITVFKTLLSPKTKLYWNDKLDNTFYESKEAIFAAITKGIQIFDLGKPLLYTARLIQNWCCQFFVTETLLLQLCCARMLSNCRAYCFSRLSLSQIMLRQREKALQLFRLLSNHGILHNDVIICWF